MEPSGKCYADYVEVLCSVVQSLLRNGAGMYAPSDPYGTDSNGRLTKLTVDWDNGFYGFVPAGANYNGDGTWSWTGSSSGRPILKTTGKQKRSNGGAYEPEPEPDGKLTAIKLTLFFSGVFTGAEKKNQASAQALPGLLDCLGLFQGQINQFHNDNGIGSAAAAAPNRAAAEAAKTEVQKFLAIRGNDSSMIQIVAHSNGNPTANYFLGLMAAGNADFRVGSMLLVAPNVDSVSTVESMFSRSSSNILMQSNRDIPLRLARVFFGASERIGAFRNGVKSPATFIPTKQRGHGLLNYRKAYCGY